MPASWRQLLGPVRAISDRVWRAWKVRGLDVIMEYGHSLGDNLLCSAVARELHLRGNRVGMITPYPELFHGNPHVARVLPVDWRFRLPPVLGGARFIRPDYTQRDESDQDRDQPPEGHILADMCQSAGIRGPVQLKPEIFLNEAERAKGRLARKQIAIVSSGAGAAFRMLNKEWPVARFQVVVDALRDRHHFVQIGTLADPPLAKVQDMRGRTSLREAAGILAGSQLFVGLVGFTMHLARAAGTPSVIVFGGREHPAQSGYPCNENIYTPVSCAPCWQRNRCDYERRCLTAIEPAHVVAAFERLLARPVSPLETDVHVC